ncbi:hypothetical protein [Streptomyces subrutilus]|uniref:Uncharacterized protein n=1 Tax=Streptomyces subrutilus TaxID=36818 RepID=A0A1E5NXF8_9ACTN|nr:hypothetical protein [Streptomyces subrutilus]OEJ20927.1 hypothetical protein BGK67_35420 [Streptomyces subrutilus]
MNAQTPRTARPIESAPECHAAQPLEFDTATESAIMEARAISEALITDLGVPESRVGHGIDPVTNTAVVRVETAEGLIALSVPEVGQEFVIQRGGQWLRSLRPVRRRRAQPLSVAAAFADVLRGRNLL